MNSNFINYFLLYLHTKKIVSDYFWFWEFHEIFASTTLLGNYYHFLTFLHKWFSFSVKLLNYRYLQWTYLIFFSFFLTYWKKKVVGLEYCHKYSLSDIDFLLHHHHRPMKMIFFSKVSSSVSVFLVSWVGVGLEQPLLTVVDLKLVNWWLLY